MVSWVNKFLQTFSQSEVLQSLRVIMWIYYFDFWFQIEYWLVFSVNGGIGWWGSDRLIDWVDPSPRSRACDVTQVRIYGLGSASIRERRMEVYGGWGEASRWWLVGAGALHCACACKHFYGRLSVLVFGRLSEISTLSGARARILVGALVNDTVALRCWLPENAGDDGAVLFWICKYGPKCGVLVFGTVQVYIML